MNLMFWRKKTGAAEEAEAAPENLAVNTNPHESLDFMEARQDAAGQELQEPEFDEAGEDDPETPSRPGLAARLRSRFDALRQRFRRPPPFRAAEDIAAEASEAGTEAEEAEDIEPDMDAPVKLGMAVRIKLQLIAMVRRFRKKPEPDGEYEDEDEERGDGGSDEEEAPEAPAKPGLFKRLKIALAAFVREFRSSAEPATEEEDEEDEHGRPRHAPEDEGAEAEAEAEAEPVRSRRWLVIGGSIVIAILLLAHLIMANMQIFEPAPKRWGTKHDQTDISSSRRRDELMNEVYIPEGASPAEVEALMRKNAELQARIEALKKAPPPPSPPPQPSYDAPARQGGEGAAASAAGGELDVDSKDPKAAAMSLKEAIEAMNAASGDYEKKPAK